MELFRIIFSVVASLVIFALNAYIYHRFLSKLKPLQKYKTVLKWIIIVISICQMVYFLTLRSGQMPSLLFAIFSSFIGVTFMLFCVSIIYDMLHIPLNKVPFDKSRRLMLKMFLDVTMLVLAFSYLTKGFLGGFKKPIVKEQTIAIKGLKKQLHIAQISDVHIGKSLGKEFLDGIVKQINALDADLVVITGDLVDLKAEKIGDKLDSLKSIKSLYGTYFVSGNHEYFHGVEAICSHLESLDVKVLTNENLTINNQINLVGITDLVGRRLGFLEPNLKQALRGARSDLPTILLAHQPKAINELKDEDIDLVISGHTHAGQIFPFGLLVLLDQPYLSGLYQHSNKTQIYVSSGVGYWGPPIRVLAPSEIVSIRLISS